MFSTTQKLDESCHPQPRVTAMLACDDNIMPLSWHMPVSKEPFLYAIAMRKENATHALLEKVGDFSLNFLDFEHIRAYDIAGSMHGGDKFGATQLTPKQPHLIKSKLVEESYMIYECKIIEKEIFGDHDIFIAKVVNIHNKEGIDTSAALFLGKGYYDTVTKNPQRIQRDSL